MQGLRLAPGLEQLVLALLPSGELARWLLVQVALGRMLGDWRVGGLSVPPLLTNSTALGFAMQFTSLPMTAEALKRLCGDHAVNEAWLIGLEAEAREQNGFCPCGPVVEWGGSAAHLRARGRTSGSWWLRTVDRSGLASARVEPVLKSGAPPAWRVARRSPAASLDSLAMAPTGTILRAVATTTSLAARPPLVTDAALAAAAAASEGAAAAAAAGGAAAQLAPAHAPQPLQYGTGFSYFLTTHGTPYPAFQGTLLAALGGAHSTTAQAAVRAWGRARFFVEGSEGAVEDEPGAHPPPALLIACASQLQQAAAAVYGGARACREAVWAQVSTYSAWRWII